MEFTGRTENGAIAVASHEFDKKSFSIYEKLFSILVKLNNDMVRGTDHANLKNNFMDLFTFKEENNALSKDLMINLLKLLAYNRDCRKGKGEREQVYFGIISLILRGYSDEAKILLGTFPTHFGYWGDYREIYCRIHEYIDLRNDSLSKYQIKELEMFNTWIVNSLHNAAKLEDRNKEGILIGKWLPSIDQSHDKRSSIAKRLANEMYPKLSKNKARKEYRKLLTRLRDPNIVEKRMASNEFGLIDPSKVPSKAMRKYRLAFMNKNKDGSIRSDDVGREMLAYKLYEITSGTSDKKLHTEGLGFYECIYPYVRGEKRSPDPVLETQGKQIIDEMRQSVIDGNFPISIALVDVSGSMFGVPMEVAVALGILIANIMPKPWNGKVLTFESNPHWFEINTNASLFEQVSVLMDAPWGGSTNFVAAINEVLKVAKREKYDIDFPMPKYIFCFSDMQFNAASRGGFHHMGDKCRIQFETLGIKMPNIIFWNLKSNTQSYVAESTTPYVSMLSGFSQEIFKVFMDGADFTCMTPVSVLKRILSNERYDIIETSLRSFWSSKL